jgi:putative membrane protein
MSALDWTFEPWVIVAAVACACFYIRGLRRLWKHAGNARGIGRMRAVSFAGGLLVLVIALASPLDALGEQLLSAHMVQHELMMLAAAPLLVLGCPLATWLWALPHDWRRSLGAMAKQRSFAASWAALSSPGAAWIQHAVVIWAWHAPRLFDAALSNSRIHVLQHLSFLASALLFWWAFLPRHELSCRPPSGTIYLFTTMLHTSALGALLTLSTAVWYAPYRDTAYIWGLTPLDDQQLAGLIMWIPAGAVYVAASLYLFGRWLSWSTARSSRPEATWR